MTNQKRYFLRIFTLGLLAIFFNNSALANSDADVQFIVQSQSVPVGVVFEVVKGDENALQWAVPKIKNFIALLKSKSPNIKFAIVSHGTEQFGLLKEHQKENQTVQQAVKSLVADGVPVAVCGTHASWYNKVKEDFPEYVEVAPAGPQRILEFQRLGYQLIVID